MQCSALQCSAILTLLTFYLTQTLSLPLHSTRTHTVFGDERKDFYEWNALYARILKSRTEAIVKRLIDKVG